MLRYELTLVSQVACETSGDFADFLTTLVSDPAKADARNFRRAVKGWGTARGTHRCKTSAGGVGVSSTYRPIDVDATQLCRTRSRIATKSRCS